MGIIDITLEDFKEIVKNGPVSKDIIEARSIADGFVKFTLYDKNKLRTLVAVDLYSKPPKILGFYNDKEVVNKTISKDFGSNWHILARKTERDLLGGFMG